MFKKLSVAFEVVRLIYEFKGQKTTRESIVHTQASQEYDREYW